MSVSFIWAFWNRDRNRDFSGIIRYSLHRLSEKKYDILTFQKEEWEIDLHSIRQSTIIGIPMGLQFSITAIGSVVLQSAVNLLGADAVVAVNAAMKILMIFTQPFEALGATLATYSGQKPRSRQN